MIVNNEKKVTIFTNHRINSDILKQIKLASTDINKQNL